MLTLEQKIEKYYKPATGKTYVDAQGRLHLEPTPILNQLFATKYRIVVMQGGGDSGKTTSTLLYLSLRAIETPNTSILVTGQDLTNIKAGALKTYKRYTFPLISKWIKQFNKSELVYEFVNGSTIKFDSFKDDQDARGQENDYVYMNECNGQSYEVFWQLQRKCKRQVILDYNPASRFWVHNKLIKGGTEYDFYYDNMVVRYISNHWHNPYLTLEEHIRYESYSDPELYRVYSLGLTGKIKGLIYSDTQIDTMPNNCERFIWGVDYGYTNDPTAIVKIGVRGKERFIQEVMYECCDDSDVIFNTIKNAGWANNDAIFVEHDKRINLELTLKGMPVYLANKKNKTSNISKCKTFSCYYTKDSSNYKKEVEKYEWATVTNSNGEKVTTNYPVDGNDHLMDAKQYAVVTDAIMNGL